MLVLDFMESLNCWEIRVVVLGFTDLQVSISKFLRDSGISATRGFLITIAEWRRSRGEVIYDLWAHRFPRGDRTCLCKTVQVAASNARKMHRLIVAARERELPAGETSARTHLEGSIRTVALRMKERKLKIFYEKQKVI